MSAKFRLIAWTSYKKRYDLVMAGLIIVYLTLFVAVGKLAWRGERAISDEILVLRALGTCGFLMLNIALCIGPLARLDRRFLPLLYNRRHLGVATFFVGLLHGGLSLGFYHGFGRLNPIVSLLTANMQYRSVSAFPFEMLGVLALLILLVMAATSHDVWLKKLSPRVWKGIHMMVYLAWGLLVMHVALGALQAERIVLYSAGLFTVVVGVPGLHVAAAWRERERCGAGSGRRVRLARCAPESGWADVCSVAELAEGRGKVVTLPSRVRVALFRYGNAVSAISNVCAHQGGPLGEGRIIDGCVTCPWHGYQYRPGDGCAPPPFTEKLPTYQVRIDAGRVWINVAARPAGTAVEPARVQQANADMQEVTHVG